MIIPALSILTIILTVFYTGMVFFMRMGWRKIPYFKASLVTPATSVSILIAARNEEDKIAKTIDDILSQDYPGHLVELIVVDDHSTDQTAEIILSYADRGVKLIRMNEDKPENSYKKKAIEAAIRLSCSELIITTDADCRMGRLWLSTIIAFYRSGDYKMISSPVTYFEERNSFEEMQTLEFLFLIGLGASGIGNKMPSTCNGANLAYRRDIFLELDGFRGIDDLASGDDELFLHKVASAYPEGIGFCKSRKAIVFTNAKGSLKDFIQQRKRWASKSIRYKDKGLVALGISVWLFNFLILLNFLAGFFYLYLWWICLGALCAKIFIELFFLVPVCKFAERTQLILYQPFVSVIHIFYLLFIGIAGNSGKYIWKGRKVR